MHAFNWLHLSDLHFGINGQAEHWPNVRTVLLNDLSRIHDRCGPWHAVLFTGDLVQCGKKEEYDRLNDEVFMPIWGKLDSLGSGKAALLAVPGNHDLNRPEIKKPSAALRQLLRRDGFGEIAEEFWTDHSSEYRKLVSTAFSQYEAWFDARPYQQGVKVNKGILPGDFTASIVLPNSDGSPLSIGIVGLNTTFLQLAGGEYFSRLACNVKQIHGACENDLPGWCKAHDACMLMTHQGPDWFDEHSRANVYPELNPAGRFATHLFGHTHETVLRGNSSAGGPMARQWQGTSLFGLEKFGEPPSIDRRHGYGAGRIERSNCQYTIRYWPRKAFKDANGWRFEPDHEGAILVEGDSGTQPEFIVSHAKQGGYQTRPATNKSSGPEKCVASDPDVGALAAVWPMEEGQFNLNSAVETQI